jgi:hypothetical protein
MRNLWPGEWYLLFSCKGCKAKQVLFPDLSKGKAKLVATYIVSCSFCGHRDHYDGELIERYQHPLETGHDIPDGTAPLP